MRHWPRAPRLACPAAIRPRPPSVSSSPTLASTRPASPASGSAGPTQALLPHDLQRRPCGGPLGPALVCARRFPEPCLGGDGGGRAETVGNPFQRRARALVAALVFFLDRTRPQRSPYFPRPTLSH